MTIPRNFLILMIVFCFLTACKGKKKSVTTVAEPVEVDDFIALYPARTLPYHLDDSTWSKKEKDSMLISYEIFSSFIPDSILNPVFAKDRILKITPLARIKGETETYLLAKTLSRDKKAVYILVFDKNEKFMAAMPVLRSTAAAITQAVVMDRKFTITRSSFRKNKDGSVSEGKEVFAMSSEDKKFALIMTEALDDKLTELINPIDTLGRKTRFTGDYSAGKMSLVSIRDGKRSDRVNFYIHFEKNNGDCIGELKGEAVFKTASMAEYKADGDPCILQFNFKSSSLSLKEVEGCGSRRGLTCSFDGSFTKKKEPKPAIAPIVKKPK